MDMDKNSRGNVIDYRKFFFFKILYNETGSKEVKMTGAKWVSFTLAVMTILCFTSVVYFVNATDSFDNLKGVLLETMVLIVAIEEMLNRDRMERLMKYINKCTKTPRYNLPEESLILEEANESVRKDIRFYTCLFAVNFPSMMLIKPIMEALSGNSWKQYPFPWTIVPDNDALFIAAFVLQMFGVGFSHCLGAIGMCSVSTLPTHISALFDIVILGIERIEERAEKKRKEKGLSYDESMLACINESLAHHTELLAFQLFDCSLDVATRALAEGTGYGVFDKKLVFKRREMRSIRPHLETPFFALMLFISMIIACEAFPLIQGNVTPPLFVKGVIFLIVDVCCTAIVCNKMEGMADRNVEIFRALYNSPWVECGIQYRKSLLNGLTFTRHPLLIQGKWFSSIKATRATFYSTMVSAFNILNMLRNVT